MQDLRRDFLASDLETEMRKAGIDSAVAVQARRTLTETQWLLDCADATSSICGVVGWAPLLSDDLSSALESFAGRPKLVGLREIVQAEPDGYLDQPGFDRGLAELTRRHLAYDLLLRERQLPEAIRLVDRHPRQTFVLDHAAKPRIADAQLEPWRTQILDLGRRINVACKLSGLVTEADWSRWTLADLRPYLDTCVEAFGPARLMAGSDWPVCLVATTYPNWWNTLSEYFAPFSESERESIVSGAAMRFYKLDLATRLSSEATS